MMPSIFFPKNQMRQRRKASTRREGGATVNPVLLDHYTNAVNNLVADLRNGARQGQVLTVEEVVAGLEPMIDESDDDVEDVANCCRGISVAFAITLQRLVLNGA
jgi:hypothetical protein